MNHPEATHQDKARKIWKIKINKRVDGTFGYKLFVKLYTQVF
jgi:hypothetical protein